MPPIIVQPCEFCGLGKYFFAFILIFFRAIAYNKKAIQKKVVLLKN